MAKERITEDNLDRIVGEASAKFAEQVATAGHSGVTDQEREAFETGFMTGISDTIAAVGPPGCPECPHCHPVEVQADEPT